MPPGVFADILACEVGATDSHSSGCGKGYQSEAVIIGSGVEALLSNDRAEKVFLPDLGISVSDDDFHVMFRAFVVGLIQTLIEFILYIIGLFVSRRIDIDQAIVEEFAPYSQHADAVIYRPPSHDSLLLFAEHYEADTILCSFAATVVDMVLK